MSNKWRFDAPPHWPASASEAKELDEPSSRVSCRFGDCDKASQPSNSINISKSANLLCESLRDLGLDEACSGDINDTPETVKSLIFKLLSQYHNATRQLNARTEASAKIENENKLIRTRLAKLNEEVSRLRSELAQSQAEARRLEGYYADKLSDLNKSKFEWEKAALDYRVREKHFVAELKRKDVQFGRLQDRARRSLSVMQPRNFEGPFHGRPLKYNEINIPPVENTLRW